MNVSTRINKIDTACNTFKKVQKSGYPKFNKLDEWLEKESNIFQNELISTKKTFKKLTRGQVIKVDFGINIGSEICYTHFAIVLNKNDSIYSDSITILPITSKYEKNRVNLGKLLHKVYPNSKKYNLTCYANLTQIRTISKTRIFQDKKNYICSNDILDKIDKKIVENYTNITIIQ